MLIIEATRTILRTVPSRLRMALLDWRLPALITMYMVLVLLVAQMPLFYTFQIGLDRGIGSDQPFIGSFYAVEGQWPDGLYRWSRGERPLIEVPGVGRRPVIVEFAVVSHRSQREPEVPPTILTLQPVSEQNAPPVFTLRREAAHYHIYLPASALSDGALRLALDTPVWQAQGDRREEIGIALGGRFKVESTRAVGLTWPDNGLLTAWPLMLVLFWVALRWLSFPAASVGWLLLPPAIGVPLIGLLDAPRLAFGSEWAIQIGVIGVLSAVVSAWLVPRLLERFDSQAPPELLRWLLLLLALTFTLKYGGQLYPDSMPGDLQLHINRFIRTMFGEIYILARHRGLPFSFPNGLYLLVAPFTLSGLDARALFPLLTGVFETGGVLLTYLALARASGRPRMGVLAAAIYALTAAGFMNTWFAFHTQVSTQWFTAALLLLLATGWPAYQERRTWWLLVLILSQMFLGHIGTFINAGLLGALVVIVLWWRAENDAERRAAGWLLAAGTVAIGFVMLFYYSSFAGMYIEQITGIATQGLVEVSGKRPIPRETTLHVLWEGGLITHYGFFPVLLAIPGALALSRSGRQRKIFAALLGCTFALTALQATLPLLTLSAIMTRWLTFAAWAIAIAAAPGVALFWRRGRAARVATLAMATYVCWISLIIFIEAMTMRKPPIEPF